MSDPIRSHVQQNVDFWAKSFQDHIGRIESFYGEVAKLETKGSEQIQANVDECARLAKETISYTSELADAWRKLCIESMKRTADMIAHRG